MNPILKRTLTGLAVGAVVICIALFAPFIVIRTAVFVIAVLALCEFRALLSIKMPSMRNRNIIGTTSQPMDTSSAWRVMTTIACVESP